MANGLDAFNTNRRAAYDDQQGLQDLVTRKQAGASLSQGDYGGAASTLYNAGDLSTGSQVQKMGQNEQDRTDERAGMEQKAEADKRLHELGFLKDSATILARIPQDQRIKAFTETIAPALKMQGMPDELIQQIAASPLDDTTLQAFGSQIDEAIKGVVMAPGSQLRDPKTGALLAEAPFAPKLEKLGAGDTLVEVPGSNPSGAAGQPRNMRNNNPGNIEDGPFAQSLPGYAGSDGRFAIFDDPKAGSAAQVALLASYGRRGIKTVQDAISRWAPASDGNDPVAYAKFVAQRLGVSPTQQIDLTDPVIASDMASAIQQFEGGSSSKSNGGGAKVVAQGAPKPTVRPATAAEKAAYGIPANVPAQMKPDGSIDVLSGTGTTQKPVPKAVMEGYLGNQASARKLEAAIKAVDAYPQAVGLSRFAGENVNQRLDPKGVDARAAIADVGSLIIHDRSGAAVTAAESPRLMPFIPQVTDTPDAVRKKLKRLLAMIQENNTGIEVAYDPGEGYQPLPGNRPAARAPAPAKAARPPLSAIFGQ